MECFILNFNRLFVNDSKKYITFQKKGKRVVRGKTLGDNYSEDKIIERIRPAKIKQRLFYPISRREQSLASDEPYVDSSRQPSSPFRIEP